jgi:uncharacterized membrane protein YagU involved in acid resistance
MTVLGQQPTHALNIVQSWDPQVASIIVLFPVILSLCIAITWSVVASVYYKADVQASTQTGFTIGSYVVTAGMFEEIAHYSNRSCVELTFVGALLIALVAFLDTKLNTSGHRVP